MGILTEASVAKLGCILTVWAHPDDETWGAGGVMARARQVGQRVVCVTATKGDAGKSADESKWPTSELAEIREKELSIALNKLGVSEHIWLDYDDGTLKNQKTEKPVNELRAIIEKVRPDTIITFGPDGITGHDDHRTICYWTALALKKSTHQATLYGVCECREVYESVGREAHKNLDIYFNIEEPIVIDKTSADLYLELDKDLQAKKESALRAHACQTRQLFADKAGQQYAKAAIRQECFLRLKTDEIISYFADNHTY